MKNNEGNQLGSFCCIASTRLLFWMDQQKDGQTMSSTIVPDQLRLLIIPFIIRIGILTISSNRQRCHKPFDVIVSLVGLFWSFYMILDLNHFWIDGHVIVSDNVPHPVGYFAGQGVKCFLAVNQSDSSSFTWGPIHLHV